MMSSNTNSDLVAVWEVHLPDGIHVVEFEHGTTSGKRVLRFVRHIENKNLKPMMSYIINKSTL